MDASYPSPEEKARTRRHNLRANARYGSKIYKENRRATLERDGHACRRCGSLQAVEVHHIVPVRLCEQYGWTEQETHALANLISLCSKHNKEADAKLRPKRSRAPQTHPGLSV